MFKQIWQLIKEAFGKMVGTKTIAEELKIMPIVSDRMADAIERWDDLYRGRAPWVKEPTFNDPARVVSLNLPAFIASERARMATLELRAEITDPKDVDKEDKFNPMKIERYTRELNQNKMPRAAYLNKVFQRKLLKKLRVQLEYGIAKGGLIIKPLVVKRADKYDIDIEFIHADSFYPLSFDNSGNITDAAFIQTVVEGDIKFRRLERHTLQDNKVIVRNKAYMVKYDRNPDNENVKKTNMILGQPVPLQSVPAWKDLQEETTIENVDRLLFSYYRQPEANTIDPYSPLGMSGFGRAERLIKDADVQYSRLLWEFEATEAAIDIDRDALKPYTDAKGVEHRIRPELQNRLFRQLDLGEDNTYEPYNPTIRVSEYLDGLNAIFMRIEDECSLSRGTISEHVKGQSATAKTAQELKTLSQRTYAANVDVQTTLEYALREAIYVMDVYCTLYDIAEEGEYDVSFEWEDSVVADSVEEVNKRLLLVQNGVMSKAELRMWYCGETKTKAKQALDEISEENKKAMKENAELQALIAQNTYTNTTTNAKDKSLPAQQGNSMREDAKDNSKQMTQSATAKAKNNTKTEKI